MRLTLGLGNQRSVVGGSYSKSRIHCNTDPAKIEDLGEICYNYRYNYENYWREEGDCDLWDVVPMEMVEFLKILGQIHRSLKIFLSRWDLELPGDIDPDCYENLHGYIEGHDLSAILDLANGQAR